VTLNLSTMKARFALRKNAKGDPAPIGPVCGADATV
jgi:hypothetical protein